jgi:ribosomal protein L33
VPELKRGDFMPTKFCPHCENRTGFKITFNVSCRIGEREEKGYLRECQDCGGRFITIQKDERIKEGK